MRFSALLVAMFIFASVTAYGNELTCNSENISEAKLLKQASHGAERIGKHTLKVKFTKGMKKFIDKPPHEELSGVHWHYCGYDKKAKAHLIGKSDYSLFTGSMLFDETGIVINAGHTVLFSPDMKKLVAIEQEDGVDGENWSLIEVSGRRLWNGYAGITRRIANNTYDSVYAQFEHPRWDKNSNLTADFVCSGGSAVKGVVILRNIGGSWKWAPHYDCR